MTQPDSKRLVTEARFTAVSNAATAAAQSQIDASAKSAQDAATAAQNSANLVGAPAKSAMDTVMGGDTTNLVIAARQRPPLMILDYATGDGTTNDTTAVSNAFTAAISQARALYSPPGKTYLIDPITIPAGLTLDGTFTFKARTANQGSVFTLTGKQDWSTATVTVDGNSLALYGVLGTDVGRSKFGSLEAKRCQVWGVQFNPSGNNNHCQFTRFTASVNGQKVTQTVTETAETVDVLTSSGGYGSFTLATPLPASYVATDATYFVISAGLVYKVRALTTTTIDVFNLKATAGVGGTVSIDIIVGGAINYPSWSDSGVHAFAAVDILSNPGVGMHHGALYGHTLNNAVFQGNGIGFACNNSTQQFTFTKPYFELNTVDYASWSYVDGVMLAPLLNPANLQNLVGRVTGNGGFDPRMVILKTQMRGLASDVVPALNPGSRTLAPGMCYAFHRSSGAWTFVINNAAGYAAFGAYQIMLDLSHTAVTTNATLTISLSTSNGDTLEGAAFGTSFVGKVTGKSLVKILKVGTDWKVMVFPDRTPASAITAAPVYVGQVAIVGTVAYIAVGTSATTDWKLIT